MRVGSPRWVDPRDLSDRVRDLESQGMTVVVVHRDGTVAGVIGVRDELRPEVPQVIKTLTGQGIGVTMLTGDNERTARALAAQAGISDVRAELRPEGKSAAVGGSAPAGHRDDRRRNQRRPPWPRPTSGSRWEPPARTPRSSPPTSPSPARTCGSAPGDRPPDAGGASQPEHVLSLLIIAALPPLAITGVLGLAAVVLIHEVAEVLVILNGLRTARSRRVTV